ncbi:MAG: hypothetical protein WC483_01535 [Candidatus Paceibacterota bacterium]
MDILDKILWFIERILSYFGQGEPIKAIRDGRINESTNNKYFSEIKELYQGLLQEQWVDFKSKEKMDRTGAYHLWVDNQNFRSVSNTQKNILVLLALCNEYSNSKNVDTFSAIRSYTETFSISFSSINDDTKSLLNAYNRALVLKQKTTIEELFSDTELDYSKVLKEFAEKYAKDLAVKVITDQLSQSEELRSTLISLIKEGRLNTYGINQKTLEKLETDLKAKANYAKTFLIMANKLPKEIEEYIKKQPGLTGFAPKSRNIPRMPPKHQFSAYIFRPSDGFKTSEELIRKFKSLTKNATNEMMVVVFPIDGINIANYTFPANQSFQNKMLKEAFDISAYFKTGTQYSDADIWNVILSSEINIDELISLIPFNVLVPGIYPSEKAFIIANYSHIQSKLGITKLTELADKSPELLKHTLSEMGAINYSREETKAKGNSDRLAIISSEIINNSKKLKDSLGLLGV